MMRCEGCGWGGGGWVGRGWEWVGMGGCECALSIVLIVSL